MLEADRGWSVILVKTHGYGTSYHAVATRKDKYKNIGEVRVEIISENITYDEALGLRALLTTTIKE